MKERNCSGPLLALLSTLLLVSVCTGAGTGTVSVETIDMGDDLAGDLRHACHRNCSAQPYAMVCRYLFKAEWYTTLSKACFDCPAPASHCQRPHCVAGDGLKKAIVTVNRRMPGPSIQVCQGDEIIVDLENDLMSDTTSIHWHGLHMVGTPYMDGVPQLTQCPVAPGTTFRYHFLADKPGTHYWHSHSGFQRADGMFGSLVIRRAADPIAPLYDIDDPSHLLVLTDWLEELAIKKFVYHHHGVHDNKPYNILVNGRGYIHPELVYEGRHPPLSAITVKQGYRHRIRSVSNSIQNCPIEVSVDDHNLTLVAKDGSPIKPVQVESFVIYGGERWDFVLEANNTIGNYWMKFHGLLDCDDRFKSAHQVAVLRYEGAPDELPSDITNMTWAMTKREGFQVNTLNDAPGDGTFLTAAEIQSSGGTVDYSGTPDHTFWVDFDFHPSDNDLFHHEEYYPFYGVPHKHRLFMPQMNYISLTLPSSPPLSQPESVSPREFCDAEHPPVTPNNNCTTDFCACLHTLSVLKDSLVELVLIDKGLTYYANHPFHLHGHEFTVVGMGKLGSNTTRQDVLNLEKNGLLMRNFNESPVMDTVTVPDGGYTVIRFRASNPGYWLFHCHISFHIEVGMGLVIKVGDESMFAPAPPNFPRCGNFVPPRLHNLKGSISSWLQSQGDQDQMVAFHLLPSVNDSNLDQKGPAYKLPEDSAAAGLFPHPGGFIVSYMFAIIFPLSFNVFTFEIR